ncbi:Uncharacterised protein (plasmid) [Tsukamurella tyrosinosolvens]|uniref:Uncharacterized protein n=1 Tax=Tsukamurella tyrosinosolvens TaxID=57704 RepID=A0A1H4UD99_TSUTY|nr:hypothetical protein [Tsukamurella tyrosinosolvens]KXO92953.1 hypothetical protein AXK58_13870 [Tsukamurella tyrosinosolvens]SEC66746.1 hypothetical protein SAMN04489793_2863 [Tsukamurella tyrosinosolvens]VEH94147.1 Uncharacterised protein [Tsukamurella tyrosinosolvens]
MTPDYSPSRAHLAWRLQMASIALQNAVYCAQAADMAARIDSPTTKRLQTAHLDAADCWMGLTIAALGGKTLPIGEHP